MDDISPPVILVSPQLAENVGTTARAMMNCGLETLRLVTPREDWLSEKAFSAASGAGRILEHAGRFETTAEAVADLQMVYATTARRRDMTKPVLVPEAAATEIRRLSDKGHRAGFLFGPERTGLENDDVALADRIVEIPLNPEHVSLNLAQAVLLIGYQWYREGVRGLPEVHLPLKETVPATKQEILGFFEHLESELDRSGFLRVQEKRPRMVRNIRNMFQRAQLTAQEVRTLHGIVKDLVTYRHSQSMSSGDSP